MTVPDADARLERLTGFLTMDPGNLNLLADAAEAAFDARQLEQAETLLAQFAEQQALPPRLVNLGALAALAAGRYDDAGAGFATLLSLTPDDPTLRFNLAWSRAMLEDWQAVADIIDEAVVAAAPRAAGLKVQALHHLGQLSEALEWGQAFIDALPQSEDLFSALSVAAFDNDQLDLAEGFARRGGEAPEAQVILGMVALNDKRADESIARFDAALARSPGSARALLGKGLAQLVGGLSDEAATMIDRSAEAFGDHLGTWISAGWAYYSRGDLATARQRFEHALALDDTFAESHGSLAVLDVAEGKLDEGRRRMEIAQRLDRRCLSAALAQTLLLQAEGRPEAAERVRQMALNQPVGAKGETIAQALTGFGRFRTPGR